MKRRLRPIRRQYVKCIFFIENQFLTVDGAG
jgi:hypothetical protein